jgi:hypothetical protein
MNALSKITTKVWSWDYTKTTVEGTADFMMDIMKLAIALVFIFGLPKSSDPSIQYINAAILLWILITVFLPSSMRLLFGRYEHYVDTD